jgi:hypothetical protein
MLARAWNAIIAAWGVVTGVLPHVLHHVGPLAGTALVAGTGGTLVFAAIGLVASIPFLLRLRRRFKTWMAPGIGLIAFAAAFSFSTFVIGPLISNERTAPNDAPAQPEPKTTDQHGHTDGP